MYSIVPPHVRPSFSGTNAGSYTTTAPTAEWGGSRTCGQQSHQGKESLRKTYTCGRVRFTCGATLCQCIFLLFSHKILWQFEALMGGSPCTHSSHQAIHQPPTSTETLLRTQSADKAEINHCHSDILPAAVTQQHPSSHASLALAQRHTPGQLNDGSYKQELLQNQLESCRNADGELVDKVSDSGTINPPPAELKCENPHMSRLSLFSGMELVTKGTPLCHRDADTMDNKSTISETSVSNTSVASDSSQTVSAFSFLNSWPTVGRVSSSSSCISLQKSVSVYKTRTAVGT